MTSIKNLQDKVIREFGFEHEKTIEFFRFCESVKRLNPVTAMYSVNEYYYNNIEKARCAE